METINDQIIQEQSLNISESMKRYLLIAAKWARFLAIVGFIFLGLFVLAALALITGMSLVADFAEAGIPFRLMGFIYLSIAVLYFFPTLYLYRFGEEVKEGFTLNDASIVTSGIGNLKSMFKFMGITMIVILAIYALIIVFAIPAAIFLSPQSGNVF